MSGLNMVSVLDGHEVDDVRHLRFLVLPEGMDRETEERRWECCPPAETFVAWLRDRGARDATREDMQARLRYMRQKHGVCEVCGGTGPFSSTNCPDHGMRLHPPDAGVPGTCPAPDP